MWFLADSRVGETLYVWADNWDDAERLCKEDGDTLLGEYVETIHISDEEVDLIAGRVGRWD